MLRNNCLALLEGAVRALIAVPHIAQLIDFSPLFDPGVTSRLDTSTDYGLLLTHLREMVYPSRRRDMEEKEEMKESRLHRIEALKLNKH